MKTAKVNVTKGAKKKFAIVVADRGWVFAGDVVQDAAGVLISGARNIRRWGTTKGLGEIAANGPTATTVLDDYGSVRIPAHAVIAVIDAERGKWSR